MQGGGRRRRRGRSFRRRPRGLLRPAGPWPHGFGVRCGPIGPRGPEPAAVPAAGGAAQGERAPGRAVWGRAGGARGEAGVAAAPRSFSSRGLGPSPSLPPASPPRRGGSRSSPRRGARLRGGRRKRGGAVAPTPGPVEPEPQESCVGRRAWCEAGPAWAAVREVSGERPARGCVGPCVLACFCPEYTGGSRPLCWASEPRAGRAESVSPADFKWGALNLPLSYF